MRRVLIGVAAVCVAIITVVYMNPEAVEFSRIDTRVDACQYDEAAIRKLWVTASAHTKDPAEQTRITADWVRQGERLCQDIVLAKPTPLPPELQQMLR